LNILSSLVAVVVDMVEAAVVVQGDCFLQQFQSPHQRHTP
jgi:hypothetical protein